MITQYSVKCRLGEKFQKLIFVKYFVSCFVERKMSEKATENGVKESDVSEPFILPSNRQPTNEVFEGISLLDLYLGIDTVIMGLLVPVSEE